VSAPHEGAGWSRANDGAGHGRAAEAALVDRRAKGGSSPDFQVRRRKQSAGIESLDPMNRGFLRAGHLPTLVAAFLYFDASFMVWVILGPLAVFIARDLHLNPAEKGLMVATPAPSSDRSAARSPTALGASRR